MAFSITNWNVDPNRNWYVRIADGGATDLLTVELYLTQTDAESQTNRQAYSAGNAFGSAVEITLTEDAGATVSISRHQQTDAWHLKVTGADDDPTKIFLVKPFVDLEDIQHPIYRNPLLVTRRATAEIDAHTHVTKERYIDLGVHLPDVEPGEILSMTSTRRGLSGDLCQILEHSITGTPRSLTSRLTAAKYQAVKR